MSLGASGSPPPRTDRDRPSDFPGVRLLLSPGPFPPGGRMPVRGSSLPDSAGRRRQRGPASQSGRAPRLPLCSGPSTEPPPAPPPPPSTSAAARPTHGGGSEGSRELASGESRRGTFFLRCCSYKFVSRPCPATCAAGGVQAGRPSSTLGGGGPAGSRGERPLSPSWGRAVRGQPRVSPVPPRSLGSGTAPVTGAAPKTWAPT